MQTRRLFLILIALILCAAAAPAQGKASSKKSGHPAKSLKDSANEILQQIDDGIHKAIPPLKKGANNALQAVDDLVHQRKKK